MLGRLSGDEFILLARGIEIESGIAPLLERIARTLDNSFMLGELEIRVEASIGAAIIDNPDITANELIRRAEEAMYMVKRGERKGFCIADEEVIRERLKVYDSLSKPLLDFYGDKLTYTIDATLSPVKVLGEIINIINRES